MITVVMILVGVALAILNSNNILVIDTWILYLVFGFAGFSFIISIINGIRVNKIMSDTKKSFNRW